MHKFFRAGILFEQFRYVEAIRILLVGLVRALCDRDAIFSYSQTGEDRIIHALLAKYKGPYGEEKGFYVDVGCNHPTKFSNTFELYKRGWRGITVDANQTLMNQHRQQRPADTSICAAVSDSEKEAIFTHFKDSLVSSMSAEHIEVWGKKREVDTQESVITVTLNTVLEQTNAPQAFDLLSIDVEGHDFEVLKSINIDVFQPQLIVIEMHDFQISRCEASDIYNYLTARGYRMAGYVTMNGFFMRNEVVV